MGETLNKIKSSMSESANSISTMVAKNKTPFIILTTIFYIIVLYLIFKNDIFKSIFIKRVFIVLCLFSFTSTIFFETTALTQLSLVENENIFGNNVRFTQPKYLSGFILSIANLESYLKIVSTSFFGAIFFKCVIFKFI